MLLIAGCATPAEKAEQRALQQVTKQYRPQSEKPALPQLTTSAPLAEFLTYALLNHPDVEAAYFDWAASVARITSAGAPPDPALTFQMDIQSIVTSLMPGLMFNFPGTGKLRAQAAVAAAESAGKYYTFEARVLAAAFAVKKTYYQLYFLTEKIAVNRATLAVLGNVEAVARQRNVVNQATLQDVLRAQMEQERLRTEIANLEDSRQPLAVQFKAALGLPVDAPEPPQPMRFETTKLAVAPSNLLAAAYARNPRLKVLAADVQRAMAALQLAAKAGVPDFSAGLEADLKMTPLLYRPQASVTLPIWRSKIRAQLAEAQAQKSAAQARLTGEQIALAVELAEQTYILREAQRNLALAQDSILPKARLALESARAGYLSNQSSFVDLTDAWRAVLGAELDAIMARTQQARRTASGRAGAQNRREQTMKTRLLMVAMLLLGVLLGWGVSHRPGALAPVGATAEKPLYTCGMHPQIIQDHPGNCPICGMKLTPIRKQEGGSSAPADGSAIAIDPVTVQNMGLRTAAVTRGPLRKIIRTIGTVEYSESALAEVTTKAKGWIEKLQVDTTGQQVHRGEPLFAF
ncbi:MAG: TolC family protein, partial [Kiritimatiellaeota bacterium]|nr:TolC family protein [Kiritimatiellota bacterium]